jgi:hypothetical protein
MQEYAVLGAIDFPWHGDTGPLRPVTLTKLLQRDSAVPWWSAGPIGPRHKNRLSPR